MSRFNTGNPVEPHGSADPRDFMDNAKNLDIAVNSSDAEVWIDRLGKTRKTFHGMETDFQEFLLRSGFPDVGDYAAGLIITARNQVFHREGELYRAGAALSLPYTTTGDWAIEGASFVAVGDAMLRQSLLSPEGSAAVGFRQSGAASRARTSEAKLRERVTLADVTDKTSGDITAELQALFSQHAGKRIEVSGGPFTVSQSLQMGADTHLIGGAQIAAAAPGFALLRLASGCIVESMRLTGTGPEYNEPSAAIVAAGASNVSASAPEWISDVTIKGNKISGFGGSGIELSYAKDSIIKGNTIRNVGYVGIAVTSSQDCRVQKNLVDGVLYETGSGYKNAYGIALTSKTETNDFARYPQSQNILVKDNVVRNVKSWHGIDTHGGRFCTFEGNDIFNCRRGIIITHLGTIGASSNVVRNNTIKNFLTADDEKGEAIWDTGPSASVRNFNNYIYGNVILGHGVQGSISGAIFLDNTSDGACYGNMIFESQISALFLNKNVDRYIISGNKIDNVFSDGVQTQYPSGIFFRESGFNDIFVSQNEITASNKSKGAYNLAAGVNMANTNLKKIHFSLNAFVNCNDDFLMTNFFGVTGDISGKVAASGAGFSGSASFEIHYKSSGGIASMTFDPATFTSNSSVFEITGLPLALLPDAASTNFVRCVENGSAEIGFMVASKASGKLAFFRGSSGGGGFSSSGAKGLARSTVTYPL